MFRGFVIRFCHGVCLHLSLVFKVNQKKNPGKKLFIEIQKNKLCQKHQVFSMSPNECYGKSRWQEFTEKEEILQCPVSSLEVQFTPQQTVPEPLLA